MTTSKACLDAETLAAYVDGGLNKSAAAKAEAHVSSCPRCQEVVGLIIKTTPAQEATTTSWIRAAWLVPLTAGVAAVGLWMIVPAPAPDQTLPGATAGQARTAIESNQPVDSLAAAPKAIEPAPQQEKARSRLEAKEDQQKPAARPAESLAAGERADTFRDAATKDERRANIAPAPAAPPAAAVAAPPPPPPAATLGRVAAESELAARQTFSPVRAKEATSPDGSLRWRITEKGALERSSDGATTWEVIQTGINVPLVSVQAPEPRTVLVTGSDGRILRSTDGGATWAPVK